MSTKEEHLKEIERDEERECREFAGVRVDALIEQLAEARAERDAALAERDAVHHQLDELEGKFDAKLSERIEAIRSVPQPSPAPVVGGVTEVMLDELWCALPENMGATGFLDLEDWFDRARAAIRAQKRVDVEALLNIAREIGGSRGYDILEVIGDLPPEAKFAEMERDAREGGVTLLDIARRCAEALRSPGPDYLGPRHAVLAVIARVKEAEQRAAELEAKLAAAECTVRESYRAVDAATAERLEAARLARRGGEKPAAPAPLWQAEIASRVMNEIESMLDALPGIAGAAATPSCAEFSIQEAVAEIHRELAELVKPPATREEMLVTLVDLAWMLNWIHADTIAVLMSDDNQELVMLRAHLAKKQEAAK